MIPYDAEKLLLFLEEEEFIVNKVKKMLYLEGGTLRIRNSVCYQPSGILVISAHQWYCNEFSGYLIWRFSVGWSEALSETGFR